MIIIFLLFLKVILFLRVHNFFYYNYNFICILLSSPPSSSIVSVLLLLHYLLINIEVYFSGNHDQFRMQFSYITHIFHFIIIFHLNNIMSSSFYCQQFFLCNFFSSCAEQYNHQALMVQNLIIALHINFFILIYTLHLKVSYYIVGFHFFIKPK